MNITEIVASIQSHIATLNDEVGGIETTMVTLSDKISSIETAMGIVQTDVEWLKKFFFIIVISIVGVLVSTIWNLVLHRRNNK